MLLIPGESTCRVRRSQSSAKRRGGEPAPCVDRTGERASLAEPAVYFADACDISKFTNSRPQRAAQGSATESRCRPHKPERTPPVGEADRA
jgi:hypothetical protein